MKEITKSEELRKENSLLKVGTPYCGPCQLIVKNLKFVETKHPEIEFYEVNAEEAEDLVDELGIRGVPALIRYKNGEEEKRRVGMMTIEQIEEFLN